MTEYRGLDEEGICTGPLVVGGGLVAGDDSVRVSAGLGPRDPWWPLERPGTELCSSTRVVSGVVIQAEQFTSEPVRLRSGTTCSLKERRC